MVLTLVVKHQPKSKQGRANHNSHSPLRVKLETFGTLTAWHHDVPHITKIYMIYSMHPTYTDTRSRGSVCIVVCFLTGVRNMMGSGAILLTVVSVFFKYENISKMAGWLWDLGELQWLCSWSGVCVTKQLPPRLCRFPGFTLVILDKSYPFGCEQAVLQTHSV